MQIAPLLKIGRGVTALIGGGGKTTLMYALTEELRARGRVILCASTRIRAPEQYEVLTVSDAPQIGEALVRRGAVCVGTPCAGGKLRSPGLSFAELAALADYVIVEADGAHELPLKAHADYEPVIPENAQRVVMVMGVDGFGKPIRDICHRPERWAELAGVSADASATPELAARVIRAEGFGDRVLINKVESADGFAAAEELSKRLTCPVVAGSLHKGVYTCLR